MKQRKRAYNNLSHEEREQLRIIMGDYESMDYQLSIGGCSNFGGTYTYGHLGANSDGHIWNGKKILTDEEIASEIRRMLTEDHESIKGMQKWLRENIPPFLIEYMEKSLKRYEKQVKDGTELNNETKEYYERLKRLIATGEIVLHRRSV